jgi:HlyD family secretion protein
MRRFLIILIIVVVLATAGVWTYQNYFAQTEEPEIEREEAEVYSGTLTAVVNATGTILPEKQTTLSFSGAGRVAEVPVTEDQAVLAGDLLARLETSDLEFSIQQAVLAVSQADLALASAQVQLLKLQRDPARYDIAAAESAISSAQAAYKRLVDGPTAGEVRVARANLDQAQASLAQAQQAYDQVADRANVSMLPQALQLEQATIARDVAKANFELTMRDPSPSELAASRSAIVQAEATLARLQEGIADEDLLAAQLAVEQAQLSRDQAQLSLDQARHQLEGMSLVAPHDGTVTLVAARVGELSGGQPAFILTDLSQYHVDVTVDEIDVGRVAEGQAVKITLDALPDEILTGRVDRIAQSAQLDAGVVAYNVTVHLDPGDAPLRVGMTANVEIVTEQHEDILLVPNRFVRIDRTTGQAFVDTWNGVEVVPLEIQIGLRDETYSEVLAGLEEGDVVVIIQQSSRERLRQAMEMGGPQ